MGKKRKAHGRAPEPQGPREIDPDDARLGPISTFEDVADSEDEYFLARDQILLDDEPVSKRRRKIDEVMELSDEEIFPYEENQSGLKNDARKKKRKGADDEADDDDDDEDDDAGWWGSSKQAYYDADKIETEADALEEEAEAKRLQKKKLSKMREEDFVFDGQEWLTGEPDAERDDETTTELPKDVQVADDATPEEQQKLLASGYPEFSYLVDEFQKLQPILKTLEAEAQNKPAQSLESIKYWVLGCYIAALASYFAIFTSPARDGSSAQKPLPPSELREHDVMETLVSCRKAWERVKLVKFLGRSNNTIVSKTEIIATATDGIGDEKASKTEANKAIKDEVTVAKQAKKRAKAKAIEDDVADLYDLPLGLGKSGKPKKPTRPKADDDSDFGEEDGLNERAAADKAKRRKSLRFYTSQIVQKANRRLGAGRDAGGDVDIPHRERLRDRQARLLAEAEKRSKKRNKRGGDEDDDDDKEDKLASTMRADEDDYYNEVAQASKTKREEKAARYAAYAAANKADRVVEKEEVGADGKRKVTYAIEKNKGLTPKRSKEVRNPRVRRRKQFDDKKKKLRSMRSEWKGGEPVGGYQGERTGINAAVIKSVKL
ncbi:Sas10/Utp3 family protein [Ophiocordyceps camponoti-floridani]|uniref:Sas10/Utp3 family protein n=1 Tax=Ophiocordyceps camponoti-floridani TaxID=2030778 RepID=A0A8H4VEE6_9HYPO|nr:Sas10/Utp3 family protein [Ophiocordyceps camponoti-floridani]